MLPPSFRRNRKRKVYLPHEAWFPDVLPGLPEICQTQRCQENNVLCTGSSYWLITKSDWTKCITVFPPFPLLWETREGENLKVKWSEQSSLLGGEASWDLAICHPDIYRLLSTSSLNFAESWNECDRPLAISWRAQKPRYSFGWNFLQNKK